MRRWIPLVVLLALALIAGAGYLGTRTPAAGANAAPEKPPTVPVTRGDVQHTVTAPGRLVAARSASLGTTAASRVAEVAVVEGEHVAADQLLVQLDTTEAALQLESAMVALQIAQARLAEARTPPTEDAIASAHARLSAAQAAYDMLAAGPSAAELNAARAAVASAQAAYDAAIKAAGTSTSQMEAAAAGLARTEAQVRQAQTAYDRVAFAPDIGMRPEALALENATIDFEQAKANYGALSATADSDAGSRVQAAQAQLRQAQASLDALQRQGSGAELAAPKAQVVLAQGDLDKLLAGPAAHALEIAESGVKQAELAIKEAQMKLDAAQMAAPFAGVVLEVKVQVGDTVAPGAALVVLSDPSTMEVRSTVIEEDLGLLQPGQAAELFFDALPDATITGHVDRIVPQRETSENRAVYPVILTIDRALAGLLPGMTVDSSIVVEQRQDVLRLPRGLVRAAANGQATVEVWDGQQAVARRIKTGLRGDVYVEILDGLSEGEEVVGQ